MSFVVASAVKEFCSKNELNCAGDLVEAVSSAVEAMLNKAAARSKGNDRKTVRPVDL